MESAAATALEAVFKLKGFIAAGRVDNMDDALSGNSLSMDLRASAKAGLQQQEEGDGGLAGAAAGAGQLDQQHSDATSAMSEPTPYYQLHAPPGAWAITARDMTAGKKKGKRLCLQREGGAEGSPHSGLAPSMPLAIYSFLPPAVNVRVAVCPASQKDAVAAVDKQEKAYAKAAKASEKRQAERANSQKGGGGAVAVAAGDAERKARKGDTIHVFSIASGHLYERFLRIMILSVCKNTANPVTFWFLEDFLSPNFKLAMPYMAEKYGFQYRWVRYNWPDNLRKQSVKMRLVWAYKILFLDTMFPPSLDKIVFVDADQVVRADLKELWDHDMKGAPLAMTPFCNDRPETDGFRFWKSGFWASHLGSNRYLDPP
jgi:UDP-glucose:glycoprotein glucosyltransferase